MTVRNAIERFDALCPNDIPYERKVEWLSEFDGLVYDEVISRHEGASSTPFTGYIPSVPGSTQLLVPFPYDSVYLYRLLALYELLGGNETAYNNADALVCGLFDSFAASYNRSHTPLQPEKITF